METRITLKSLKIAEFASEETLCFEAKVYFDGHLCGIAENDGRGGSTFIHPANDDQRKALDDMGVYVANLPPRTEQVGGEPFTWQPDVPSVIDSIAGRIADQRKVERTLRRLFKTKLVVYKGGKDFLTYKPRTKGADPLTLIPALLPKLGTEDVILNTWPFEKAVELYMERTA